MNRILQCMLFIWVAESTLALPANVHKEVPFHNYCKNTPPGLNKMRSGVDITKLDLLPLKLAGDGGIQQPIIDFTCDNKKVWTNPFNNKQYDLPDQVANIASVPGGVLDFQLSIYKHTTDIQRKMSTDGGVNILGGLFSASGSYESSQREIWNNSRYIQDVSTFTSSFKTHFSPYWRLALGEDVAALVERLPENFDQNPQIFAEFIDFYGSHYFQDASFGGKIRLYLNSEKALYNVMTEKDVKASAEATFFNYLGASGAHNQGTKKVDEKFTQKTEVSARYYGGNANFLGPNKWTEWQPSVAGNPWLFSGKLLPITRLIANDKKRQAMDRAVEVHVDKAHIRDLERQLNSFVRGLETRITKNGEWESCDRNPKCYYRLIGLYQCACKVSGCEKNMLNKFNAAKIRVKEQAAAFRPRIQKLLSVASPLHDDVTKLASEISGVLELLHTGERDNNPLWALDFIDDNRCDHNRDNPCLSCSRWSSTYGHAASINGPISFKKAVPNL